MVSVLCEEGETQKSIGFDVMPAIPGTHSGGSGHT